MSFLIYQYNHDGYEFIAKRDNFEEALWKGFQLAMKGDYRYGHHVSIRFEHSPSADAVPLLRIDQQGAKLYMSSAIANGLNSQ